MKSSTIMLSFCLVAAGGMAHAGIIDDFDGHSLGQWTSQARSSISVVTTKAQEGTHSLLWTYHNDGTAWNNEVILTFSSAQDWTDATEITVYLDSGTVSAIQRRIGFYLKDGTTKYDYGYRTSYDTVDGFQKVTFLLTGAPVNGAILTNVTKIGFYAASTDYNVGDQQFYIDNITVNTPVPEPAALGILTPICIIGLYRRSKIISQR